MGWPREVPVSRLTMTVRLWTPFSLCLSLLSLSRPSTFPVCFTTSNAPATCPWPSWTAPAQTATPIARGLRGALCSAGFVGLQKTGTLPWPMVPFPGIYCPTLRHEMGLTEAAPYHFLGGPRERFPCQSLRICPETASGNTRKERERRWGTFMPAPKSSPPSHGCRGQSVSSLNENAQGIPCLLFSFFLSGWIRGSRPCWLGLLLDDTPEERSGRKRHIFDRGRHHCFFGGGNEFLHEILCAPDSEEHG